ncbi:MAG TPA: hypothetical protein VGB85_03925 [Nannocystis sp.]
MQRHRRWTRPLILVAALLACKTQSGADASADAASDPAKPGAVAAVDTKLEPLPALRTGTRTALAGKELAGKVTGRSTDATHEYLELALPLSGDDTSLDFDWLHVELTGSGPGDIALVASRMGDSEARVVVRRKPGTADAEVTGALFGERWNDGKRQWTRVPFRADSKAAKEQAELKPRFVDAFAAMADADWRAAHPWLQFAAGRVHALIPNGLRPGGPQGTDLVRPTVRTDLSQLMDTTTGVMSMQEALQHDRGLRVDRSDDTRTISVGELGLPPLDAHPFPAMQAKLPDPAAGAPEPLAAAVPADFWYARVDDIRLMLRLMDEADAWITPVVQILQRNPEDRHLADRYQTQLGLRRTDMAKLFGHTVVGQVALTGSDPYLREGSDVTMIFSVKQQAIFDQELTRHIEALRAEVPGLVSATRDYNGVTIAESRDPTGAVRQQRAQVGELAIVSNSPRACERVIDAVQGKTARLGDEPDLKYMLARDPGTHQAFVFLSDKFIAAVIGPQQKVLAARRQLALAELLTPGYAALLHGWLFGAAPASTDALVASGLLFADELKHRDGAAIAFAPGSAASSPWGRPSALTPLIDLPPVTQVSAAEKTAYENFVSGYQQYWKQFIDPVAIRIDVEDTGATSVAQIDVRILPLISATDYSEIEEIVGGTRVQVSAVDRGLQGVWAVGKDARLRKDLDGVMHAATGQTDIGIGWLGDWVLLGIEDRAALVELMARFDFPVQLAPASAERDAFNDIEMWRLVGRFPVYAAAEVKNPAMLVATLAAIKTMLGGVAPGMVDWGETAKHRDLPIVRVGASKSAPLPNREIADAVALYYVQTGEAVVLAIDLETLKRAVDRVLDGKAPKASAEGSSQFVVEGHSQAGAPLWTALLWLIQGQANEAQSGARRSAEILMRGDPGVQGDPKALAQRGLDYFGFAPVTAQGDSAFTLAPEGAGDALLGTSITPIFVPLPIAGSPVERLMQRLTGVRGEVSFDKEPDPAGPNARSLHTRFSLHLGAAQ